MAVLGLRIQDGSADHGYGQSHTVREAGSAVSISSYTEQLRRRFSELNLLDEDEAPAATLLGQALALVYPVQQAELLAKQLLSTFGSLGASLSAQLSQVQATVPNGSEIFLVLRAIHRLLLGTLREKIQDGIHLGNSTDVHNYLKLTLSHQLSEQVRLLHLDTRNRLIRDELHATGTTNQVAIYPRQIVKRALEMNASALIIVHNHPSGDPTPSTDDIDMTRLIMRALNTVGIHFHDHIIVGKADCFSMRAEELLRVLQ